MKLVTQMTFDLVGIKVKQKRIRNKNEQFFCFYTIYKYNKFLYAKLINEKIKGLNNYSPNEILEKCFIRDESGEKIRDSDEKHIYRYKQLYLLYNLLFCFLHFYNVKDAEKYCNIYTEEQEAEIKNTWRLSIKERVLLHLYLLKYLRQGMSIDKALRSVNAV